MRPEFKKEAALGLKVASGHLEAVRRMVDEERYCIDIMKQLAAVQASLSRVQQILLRNHLATCVASAMRQGLGDEILDELMGAFKFEPSALQGRSAVPLEKWPAEGVGECGCNGGSGVSDA